MTIHTRALQIAGFTLLAAVGIMPAGAGEQEKEAALQQAVAAYNANAERPSQEVVCKHETRIGSRIKRPVCRTRGFLEQEKRDVRRYMNKPRPSVTRDEPLSF